MPTTEQTFDRLEQALTIIAEHADYPGKQETVAECMADVEDRWSRGLLTLEQRLQLRATLHRGKAARRNRGCAASA